MGRKSGRSRRPLSRSSSGDRRRAFEIEEIATADGPRQGARSLVQDLAKSGPPRLLQVSCDPATMARDASTLSAGGYRIEGIEIFDFYGNQAVGAGILVKRPGL